MALERQVFPDRYCEKTQLSASETKGHWRTDKNTISEDSESKKDNKEVLAKQKEEDNS